MHGTSLGPSYDADAIAADLERQDRPFERVGDDDARARRIAGLVASGAVVGLFQGRMEFGPRALGNRSIIADARRDDMAQTLNAKVKKREGFRPFAPAVLAEKASEWFELDGRSPYMTVVAQVHASRLVENDDPRPVGTGGGEVIDLVAALSRIRSTIPAVTAHMITAAQMPDAGQTFASRPSSSSIASP